MFSIHQEISHEITFFKKNIKAISIFIWLTHEYYFPKVLHSVLAFQALQLNFSLHIFIIRFLAKFNVAYFNNNYIEMLGMYYKVRRKKIGFLEAQEDFGQGQGQTHSFGP